MVQEIWVEKWDKSGLNSPPPPLNTVIGIVQLLLVINGLK